jgi:hypothetical protein
MTMLRSIRLPVVCVAVLVPLVAGQAGAQASKSDAAQAESLFVEAKKLMDAGRYAQACPLLAESQRLDPGGGTLLNLAACHEKEGRIATAWAEFNAAKAVANKDARADRVTFAQERIAALEPLLPRLTISAPASAVASGYEIVLDDVKRGSVTWGHASPIDPGHHVIRATASGKRAWERAFDIQERQTLVVEVPALEELASPTPASTSPDAKMVTGSSGPRPWAFVAGGAGIAALAVGSYLGLEAKKLRSESDEQCPTPTGECTQWAVDKNDSARRTANFATVAFAVGIVGVGVGTYLLLVPSQAPASRAASASGSVSAWVTGDCTGVTWRGRF